MRWVLALVLAGCYAPQPQPGAPCASGRCPDGLVCSPATDTCERTAVDIDATRDAPIDSFDPPKDAPAATAVLIQQAVAYNDKTTTLSATLPAMPAGNTVLLLVGANLSGSLTSVTGAATWTRATSSLVNSNVEIWYGIPDATGATVTISRANDEAPMWLAISEWAGLATTLDSARAAAGTTNPVNTGTLVTTTRDLLVFSATAFSPNTHALPTPGTWTAMPGITGVTISQSVWYRVESVPGSYAIQTTQTSSGAWDAAIAAFRIAP